MKVLKFAGSYLGGLAAVAVVSALLHPRFRPSNALGWVGLAMLLGLLYLCGQAAFEVAFSPDLGQAWSRKPIAASRLSLLLLLLLPFVVVACIVQFALGTS